MDLIKPIRSCIDEIVRETGPGLKSMVLDEFTSGVVSVGYSRSDMLLREVYLFEYINTMFESTERLNHMKCIVILRPTKENVELLCQELNRPHYKTYHLYFVSRIGSTTVEKLAQADETEVVRCLRELPIDFQPATSFLFSLRMVNKTFDLCKEDWLPEGIKRSNEGLTSALIALRVNPVIRYQTQSKLCMSLAKEVSTSMREWRQVIPFDEKSLLLIIDRRTDLITPIINKWTYYAMIHELFEVKSNRISLVEVPNRKPKDPKEMLISIENDDFFRDNYYKNFGELGTTLKSAVEKLKTETKSQGQLETMDDMKRFIDEYPETRRYASNIHNHVFLMSELSRIVTEHDLIRVSECEQDLACKSLLSSSEVFKNMKQAASSDLVKPIDAIRLVSLYIVCRSDRSKMSEILRLLKNRKDIKSEDIEFVKHLGEFFLSKPQNPLDETVQQVTRMIVKGVKGVENVLTQYQPQLNQIIDDLRRGNRLKEAQFAFHGERHEEPPRKIIVFFVGGVTYEESLVADQFNRLYKGCLEVIVGGTSLHNFRSFMNEVRQTIRDKEANNKS